MKMLSDVEDPRRPSNGTRHDFVELLVMTISAVLADCDTIEEVAAWSRAHVAWLRQFLVLKNGVPSEDTFLRVFRLLDPKPFEKCFRRWVSGVLPALAGTVAIDGKTVRGSGAGGEMAIHMVSAFETRLGLVLGQEKVSAKSNEITAIPELLDALYLKGFLVSIDAMGCQRAIAGKIVAKGADYLLAVKGNQPALQQAIQTAFLDQKDAIIQAEQVFQGHGRVVAQRCSVLPANGVVPETDWPHCAAILRIDSLRQVKGKSPTMEQRYYIASRELDPLEAAAAVRSHWAIENQLHWVLDVTMREDDSSVRTDHAPENLSLLKKIVLNLLRMDKADTVKSSLKIKRKRADWDARLRERLLGLELA
ncbi:MAG: ISAs1 family transposase [Rhodocyclales bacterium]|nr:ISAs1 family transposase [Rhodocyclales bacterium]